MLRRATNEGGRSVSWRRVRTDSASSGGDPLCGRHGHVVAAVPRGNGRDGSILVFGGFSDHQHGPSAVLSFDPHGNVWETVREAETELEHAPSRRAHHTVCESQGTLFFFGGEESLDGGGGSLAPNELDTLNTKTYQWNREAMQGYPPSARKNHSAELVGNQMYLFGGVGLDGVLCPPDMYILDLSSKMCIMAFADGPEPEARMGHTCTLVGHKLYIIGGKGADGRHMESIHILDTAALVWEKADVSHTPLLAFHSAAAVDDHTIALFGGEGPDGQPLPDLHLLNTEKMVWSVPHVSGVLPSGRSHHAWAMVNEKLYLFGGVSTEARAAVSLNDVFILTPFENLGDNLVSGERSLIYLSATEEVEEEVEEEVTVVNGTAGDQATEVTTRTERWQERQRVEGTMIEVRVIKTREQQQEETVLPSSRRARSASTRKSAVMKHAETEPSLASSHLTSSDEEPVPSKSHKDKKASGERRQVRQRESNLERRAKKHQSGERSPRSAKDVITPPPSPPTMEDRKQVFLERLEENQRLQRGELLADIRDISSSASAGRAAEVAALQHQQAQHTPQKANKRQDRASGEEKQHGRRKSFGALVSRLSDLRPRTPRPTRTETALSPVHAGSEGDNSIRSRRKSRSQELLRTSAAATSSSSRHEALSTLNDDFQSAQSNAAGDSSSSSSSTSPSDSNEVRRTKENDNDESRKEERGEAAKAERKRRARSKSQDQHSLQQRKKKKEKGHSRTKSSSTMSRKREKSEIELGSRRSERRKNSKGQASTTLPPPSKPQKMPSSSPFPFVPSTSSPQLRQQRSPDSALMLGVRFLSDTTHSLSRSRSLMDGADSLDSSVRDIEPPLLQGWLTKKDNKSGEWKLRWCRLMAYPASIHFHKDEETTMLGSISLVGALMRVHKVEVKKGLRSDLAWSVASPGERESTFVAKNAKQKRKWVEAIRKVSEAAEEWNGDRNAAAQCLALEIADIDRQIAHLTQLKTRKIHHRDFLFASDCDGGDHQQPPNDKKDGGEGEDDDDTSSSSTSSASTSTLGTGGSSSLDPFGFVTMTGQDIRSAIAAGRQQMKKEDAVQKSCSAIMEKEERKRKGEEENENETEEATEEGSGEEWKRCMDMSVNELIRELIRYKRMATAPPGPPSSSSSSTPNLT